MLIYCICTQYLVGAPFALITASIRRGMEVISLWHCLRWYGSPGFFDSGLQLICIVGSGVLSSSTRQYPIDSLWVQVRRVCWPIKHSNTMVIEPAFGTFGSVGQVPSPAGK